jgi:hypothetical protein
MPRAEHWVAHDDVLAVVITIVVTTARFSSFVRAPPRDTLTSIRWCTAPLIISITESYARRQEL